MAPIVETDLKGLNEKEIPLVWGFGWKIEVDIFDAPIWANI